MSWKITMNFTLTAMSVVFKNRSRLLGQEMCVHVNYSATAITAKKYTLVLDLNC